jgi:hypothetical protein
MKRARCVPILASSRPFGKARMLFRLMPKKAPELSRSPLLLPTFQQKCPDKTKFSGSQVQRYSLRLVFLPLIRFTAKSAAPVGSSCQSRLCSSARRIPQNRAVLASAPLGSAPLRRLTAPPCAPSLANYETNVFYWPAKAQLT